MASQRPKSPRTSRVAAEETPPTPTAATGRRKAGPVREWLVISVSGCSYLEEGGKHSIMRRTGLPARDLRMLDPLLSYPSTILGREQAIVVNLEHIRAIITASEVLIPNSKDPLVAPFVQHLKSRILTSLSPPQQGVSTSQSPSFPEINESPAQLTGSSLNGHVTLQRLISQTDMEEDSPKIKINEARYEDAKVLPFEFQAIEVCLESVCKFLEEETSTLEKEAYPALDELTSKSSTLNLERVRQIKSRLVALTGRVQKVRDEIEHLLDDDADMAEMHLTDKLIHVSIVGSRRFGMFGNKVETNEEGDQLEDDAESSNGGAQDFNPAINELEMLLHAYFVQIDGALCKLSTLREYGDDTEDYINIRLDDKQNQLLQMGVMLNIVTLVTTAAIVVTGVLGINIHIEIFNAPYIKFWETVGGLVGGGILVCIIAFYWGSKSGLLQ